MKFILFRHAHKGNSPYDDPELSPQGFKQASDLLALVKAGTIPLPSQLLVSPKRRTSQTFYPISKEFNLPSKISIDLDQRSAQESTAEFRKRVLHFMGDLESFGPSNSVIYACTHYDWIEESMTLINCDKDLNTFEFSHWSPAQYLVFENQDGLWKFLKKGILK